MELRITVILPSREAERPAVKRRKMDRSYLKFEKLCKSKKVRPADVARVTGIGNSTFSDWKTGLYKPKVDKLVKIAKFFNVPLESLL